MKYSRAVWFIVGFVAASFTIAPVAANFEWWRGAWEWVQNDRQEMPRQARHGSLLRPHAKHCNPYAPRIPKIDDVLKRADRIVLAKVRSVRSNPKNLWIGNNVIYTLDVVMVVKGKGVPKQVELAGVKPKFEFAFDPALLDATYRHAEFLAKATLTESYPPQRERFHPADAPSYCEYAPYFEVGINYLIVLPEPYTAASFEPILTFEDAWLNRVQSGYGNRDGYGLY